MSPPKKGPGVKRFSYWADTALVGRCTHEVNRDKLFPELKKKKAFLESLVPTHGPADLPDPEATKAVNCFRDAANVYYDVYNNGAGNFVDPDCESVNLEAVTAFLGERAQEAAAIEDVAYACHDDPEVVDYEKLERAMDSIIEQCYKAAKAKSPPEEEIAEKTGARG